MVSDVQTVEPESAHLSQHASFVRDAGRKNPVEGADSVRCDEQQPVVEFVNVADFPCPPRQTWKGTFQIGVCHDEFQ